MESFNKCLRVIQQRCVIRDAEYWDLQLLEDEIPILGECNDTTLSVTFKGFNLFMELREESFHVFFEIPKDFNHDPLDFSGIMDPAIIEPYPEGYGWSYRYYGDANLFRPLESQNRHCVPSGPVQIMETCRALILEIIRKKHKTPTETFRRNLKWMQQQCNIKNPEYWDLKLEKGETMMSPDWNLRCIQILNSDFVITIKLEMGTSRRYLHTSVQVPHYFFIDKEEKGLPIDSEIHFRVQQNVYAWNYGHTHLDADLSLPVSTQFIPGTDRLKQVSGPVQVMEDVRQMIHTLKSRESMLRGEKKYFMTQHIKEDLMMKTCHPKRIAQWVHQGFEPFEE